MNMPTGKTCESCGWWGVGVCSAGHADIMRRRGQPGWSCPYFQEVERVKPGRRGVPRAVPSLSVPGLIDVVLKDGQPAYLLGPEPHLEDQVATEDIVMIPPVPIWATPTDKALDHIDEDDFTLFEDVEDFIYQHLDLPHPAQYSIMGAFVLATWVYDKLFDALPFLAFVGPYSSGKTRALEVLARICRRAIHTASLTEANVFRPTELFEPTLLIDELDLGGHDERSRNVAMLLNARYKRGLVVLRSNPEKSGLESVETYRVYGPTALATTKTLSSAIKSRCLIFPMIASTRPVKKRFDEQMGQELRDRLLAFRIRHMGDPKDEPHAELNFLSGRLAELFNPLMRIAKICRRIDREGIPIRAMVARKEPIIRRAIVGKASESPILLSPRGQWWRLMA